MSRRLFYVAISMYDVENDVIRMLNGVVFIAKIRS